MNITPTAVGHAPDGGQEGAELGLGQVRLQDSWRRSMEEYRLDPARPASPRILSANECRVLREQVESFLRVAQAGVNRLHEQIRDSGYCVLLTNAHGATIDFRGHPSLDREYRGRGFRLGACWSEEEEGTCGVGTAIVERSPILVHKEEHFRAHNYRITCSAAPILGPDEEMLGILNASALSAPDERRSQALIFRLVAQNAALIESAVFAEAYRAAWVLRLCPAGDRWGIDEGQFLALDCGGRIIGGSRRFRTLLTRLPIPPIQIEDLLDTDFEQLLRHAHERPGVPLQLRCHATGTFFLVHLRAPLHGDDRPVRRTVVEEGDFCGLATGDPGVAKAIARIKLLADSRMPILLMGETGSGKEAFARAIHRYSNRRDKPFVALNCAAIPENLIESELFGYREGAFTGARAKGCPGKVQLASGGTLFLDEIGDMPLGLQTRLLRVLAEGEVMALGAAEAEKVDLHVLCATHRDLEEMVAQGQFREDLFYRLNAATFRLPPLRERADIREVIRRVFAEEQVRAGRKLVLPTLVEDMLCAYSWPGNIRELRNVLCFAIAVCEGVSLDLTHLPGSVLRPRTDLRHATAPRCAAQEARGTGEREAMIDALRQCGWHVAAAASQIGMSRSTFYRRLRAYGIVSPNLSDG